MARTIGIGVQDFAQIIEEELFYVDKTLFIKEWWESGASVTLITRPRRFGKTLNMNMTERFFSIRYQKEGSVFERLAIWREQKYRDLQGTYPVISLSFANIKEQSYIAARRKICQLLEDLYNQFSFVRESGTMTERDRGFFDKISVDMDDTQATLALNHLAYYLHRYYGKKVLILLDEYDTPMQEAYDRGYWDEMVAFTRSLFNATFKTNPSLYRAIMTGITRISKESVFSDLNNLEIITATSVRYASCFGFTGQEVQAALQEMGYSDFSKVKEWYDGFIFGNQRDIYNPWSIVNYLDKGKLDLYWANTSENSLAAKLIREGNREIKQSFERLLQGECLKTAIDEQIVYSQIGAVRGAVWSLLLAGGYLKVVSLEAFEDSDFIREPVYTLRLTNLEVRILFYRMIKAWFLEAEEDYNAFVKALLDRDVEAMNVYMNEVALKTFGYFDSGKQPGERAEPERFYHGFVLGLIVELGRRYHIRSNRESGLGRYDVMLEPKNQSDRAVLMEFKVRNPVKEKNLEETVRAALKQIEDKKYVVELRERGIPEGRIDRYGFAFEGKTVRIGAAASP